MAAPLPAARGALALALALALLAPRAARAARYDPTWASLDTRPLPQWYSDAKVGIFIHFGVFSVPSFHGEWFWSDLISAKDADVVAFVAETEAPGFTYPEYAARFDATFFNATQWLDLFKSSGAKYVVPTTKHHEGVSGAGKGSSANALRRAALLANLLLC